MRRRSGYRSWSGDLRSRTVRWWPLARSGIALVFRRRIFWLVLLLGLLNFLFHFALIYFLAQIQAELSQRGTALPPFVRQAVFTGTGRSYRDFISVQSTVVMLLLAFAGSVLVGNDFRFRSVSFYLSRPIGRIEYLLGKLGAVAGLTSLITLVPALVLFLEYGLFTESLEYFRESQRIFWAILAYGTLVSVAASLLLLGTAALLQRTILILVVWGGIFVFLPMVSEIFRQIALERRLEGWPWKLLDFWWLMRRISDAFFGIAPESSAGRLPYAVLVLAVWMTISLWLFWKRVTAVEVA